MTMHKQHTPSDVLGAIATQSWFHQFNRKDSESPSVEIGIAPKVSTQLFQPYSLEEGIGLGMSLARDGVERVGRLSHQVAIISPGGVEEFTVVEQPNIFTQIVAGHNVAVEVCGPER